MRTPTECLRDLVAPTGAALRHEPEAAYLQIPCWGVEQPSPKIELSS